MIALEGLSIAPLAMHPLDYDIIFLFHLLKKEIKIILIIALGLMPSLKL